jgi:hypothetical protein
MFSKEIWIKQTKRKHGTKQSTREKVKLGLHRLSIYTGEFQWVFNGEGS